MAGLESIAGIAGGGVAGLGSIAEAWQQQLMSGTTGTAGVGADLDVSGLSGAQGVTGSSGVDPTSGLDFGSILGNSLQSLEATDKVAQNKAVQAATGDLNDIHDYVIAANQAQVATELTTTIRNKALDAFNEIMRMPL